MMAETRNGSFAAQIQAWVDKTKANTDELVRQVTLDVGTSLVYRSPVGNPELWARNKLAANYNRAVDEENARLRTISENLTKAGKLRPGLKINDSMKVHAPKGYVGGHFRANWQFGTTPPTEELDAIDPAGTATIAAMEADISSTGAGGVTYIVNNAPYAIPLEYGHSSQAPQGMVRITIAEFDAYVQRAAERLK